MVAKKSKSKKTVKPVNPLFPPRPKNVGIGGSVLPAKDLTRYVKWPRYIRLQRQKKILWQRLKVPPAINQFTNTLGRNQAVSLFKLMAKYKPETKAQKKERLQKIAEKVAADKNAKVESEKAPNVLKFGLKHITNLVESKKAKLVAIANDVDPIELVVWLPALCRELLKQAKSQFWSNSGEFELFLALLFVLIFLRKMDVPYCIVKNKAKLGTFVNQKNVTALAITSVSKEDEATLEKLADICKTGYNDNMGAIKNWGGGILGAKTQARISKQKAAVEQEEARKKKMLL
eukprot:maker-scaffold_12-augustus-gene-8.48-mRNA-1 protein AED:0.05 eAED:0.05 QI:136/0.66/0.75/1/0.33/0.25/4/0/288